MDQKENPLYLTLLISSIVLLIIVGIFTIFMLHFYRKKLALQKELDKRNLSKLENERQRIAANIRTTLNTNLQNISQYFHQQINEDNPEYLKWQKGLKMIDRTMLRAEDLLATLSPARLSQEGIVLAIDDLCQVIQKSYNVMVVFHHGENIRMSTEKELHLFRIAEEILQNVAEHAKASDVFVSLSATEKIICLLVTDDGIGLNVSKIRKEKTPLGIRAILAHAEQLDAEVHIEETEGSGTTFLVEIPI